MDTAFEENLFVKIKLKNNDKLLIGIIYRSPSNKNMEHHNQLRKCERYRLSGLSL
jgi:hypothetical protein